MTDEELARIDALLAAAREVAGCSDHGCVLRVYPRGGMGTNGGCRCVGRVRTDEGLTVQADRLDLVRLLALARQTPALVAEVRRLRAEIASVTEDRDSIRTVAVEAEAEIHGLRSDRLALRREVDLLRAEVDRLRR